MSVPLIRPASLPHAELLSRLHGESFGTEGWSAEQMAGSLKLVTTRCWIAYLNTEASGFILCQTTPKESEILTFCVRPSGRRQKIGENLLRHAITALTRETGMKIWLEVAADNFAARKLYERLGFTLDGTRPGYYKRDGKAIDALLFSFAAVKD